MQPLLSRELALRNQQNNAINCNFRQALSKHLITLWPKAYLFFSKSLSFSGLCKILRLLGGSKRETLMVSKKIPYSLFILFIYLFIIYLFQDLYKYSIYTGVRTKGHNIPYKVQPPYPTPTPLRYIYKNYR